MLSAALAAEPGAALGDAAVARVANGEIQVRIETAARGRVCAVLGSLAPPDQQLLSVLLLADTLRREGAREVIGLLPYLGYARQDRPEPGASLGVAWAGTLAAAAGIERVITLDVHSHDAARRFGIPLVSLSPAPLFASALMRDGLHELTVVAPDEGALGRCEEVRRSAGISIPVAHLNKRRDPHGVTHSELVGDVSTRVAIVDDILDTAGTLVSACAKLVQAGVREIVVCVTHGLFTGERWHELPSLGVRRIYTTDTVPASGIADDGIVEVLTSGPLVLDALAADARGARDRSDR